jgi:hypothetical protein
MDSHNIKGKDGSSLVDKKFSPICFRMKSLTQMPIQAIPYQLVSLAVHEHVHHYGFGEEEAVEIQKIVLEMFERKIQRISEQFSLISALHGIQSDARKVIGLLSEKSQKLSEACFLLGSLNTQLNHIIEDSIELSSSPELELIRGTHSKIKIIGDLEVVKEVSQLSRFRSLLNYRCDQPLNKVEVKEYIATLNELVQKAREIELLIVLLPRKDG